jgi:nucleoporin NUP82
LDTPEINFNIESILPNKNGRLLSVTGHARLVIVCLPRQGFSDVSDSRISRKKIDCRTLSVGSKYYDSSNADILKIQWHPLSETRTHIVVLGNDNILR